VRLGADYTLVAADLSATVDPGLRYQSPVFLDQVGVFDISFSNITYNNPSAVFSSN
jgi:hypothetical protein